MASRGRAGIAPGAVLGLALVGAVLVGCSDDAVSDDPQGGESTTTTVDGPASTPTTTVQVSALLVEGDLAIWLEPDIAEDDRLAVEREVAQLAEVETWRYVDREVSFEEFQSLFADQPELLEVVAADQLPTSYRLVMVDGTPRETVVELARRFDGRPGVRDTVVAYAG